MTVRWNGEAVLAKVKAAAATGIARGTEAVREEATSLVVNPPKTGRLYRRNGRIHQASAPGEHPANDTGFLIASIATETDENALKGSVNIGAEYGKFLEYGTVKMAPRPFARPALMAKKDEITADIADEIGKALK